MRRVLPLLLLAFVCVTPRYPAFAKPADGPVIKDKDLKPHWKELAVELDKVRNRKLTIDEVLMYFRSKAKREKEPRVKAIRTYIHGIILMDLLKRPKDAHAEFDTALKLFASFPAALGRLATIAHEAKDTRHAIRLLHKALDLDPTYTKALNYLGTIRAQQKEFQKAIRLFTESFELDSNVAACVGLCTIYVHLYHDAFVEKHKQECAEECVRWAEFYKALAPNDGNAYRMLAKVYTETLQPKKAVEVLEQSQQASIPDKAKVATLHQLYMLYARYNKLDDAIGALKRMLKFETLVKGKDRTEIEGKIKDLETNGSRAFLIWYVQHKMEDLKNPGHDPQSRVEAVRELFRYLTDPEARKIKELADLRLEVLRTAIRSLKNSPPEVTIEIFRFFQDFRQDPKLLRILVHFIYPADDAKRTPDVRREAVRTIALLGGVGAIPTLHYCLRDEPGTVLREVERQLTRVTGARSRVGEGMEPLTREQAKYARKAWRKWFHTDEGVEKIIEALKKLRDYADMTPSTNRSIQTKPMADHIAQTILLDSDVPWEAWLAGYEFMRDYLKEFRPVKEHGTPVKRTDRKAITDRIAKFFAGGGENMPEVDQPGVKDEKEKKSEDKPEKGD